MARPRSSARSTLHGSSLAASGHSLWDTIALEAGRESELWAAALRPDAEREEQAVFSPLAEDRFAVGLETIYEGYLLHYGESRAFAGMDADMRLLAGDTLYALGLARLAESGDLDAVAILSDLISASARAQAEGRTADAEALWESSSDRLRGRSCAT